MANGLRAMSSCTLSRLNRFSGTSPIMPLYLQDLGLHDPSTIDFWSGVLSSVYFLISAAVSPLMVGIMWSSSTMSNGRPSR